MIKEKNGFGDSSSAILNTSGFSSETFGLEGHYHVLCHDKDGNLKWEEKFDNQVVQIGKQLMLDTLLRGSAYTVVGPFLGLVSGSGNTFSPTDTMTSHAGWTEFIAYTYASVAQRGTYTFTASTGNNNTTPGSNVVTSTGTALTFTMTGSGTVGGCFLVTGTGAVVTLSSTAGTLYSAGAFGTAKTVTSGDTVAVTYSTTATS
jgi:hypothetical protein